MGSLAKHWAFTLNDYTDDDEQRIAAAASSEGVVYVVYGREVASTGTPHLQGHVSLSVKKRQPQLVRLFGQAHYTVARSVKHSIDYCKKDGDYTEFGTPENVYPKFASQGARKNLTRNSMR